MGVHIHALMEESCFMEELRFSVSNEAKGERVDKYLAGRMPDKTRSFIQKLIKEEGVTANGNVLKANYKLCAGDELLVSVPRAREPDIIPEDIPLSILYEDDDVLVVDKPKGMVVHPAPGHYSGTLVNAVLYHCKGRLSGINGIMRPGIVHRIDMDTTGSLLICKNDLAHQKMAVQLKEHSITRKYHAIVHGILKDGEGTISLPIGRHPVDRKKMSTHAVNAKDAVTHFKVIRRFDNCALSGLRHPLLRNASCQGHQKDFTYVECTLETGRTHQIRVHMASIGHPVLGDEVYGPAKCPFKLQGQTLHAKILGIEHPSTGKYMEFDAPLPEYFQDLLDLLEGRKMGGNT